MAINFDFASSTMVPVATTSASANLQISTTVTNRMVVAYGASINGGADSMAYNGAAMTQAALMDSSASTSGNLAGIGVYYLLDAGLPTTGGTYAVSATFAVASSQAVVGAVALSNVDQSTSGHVIATQVFTNTSSTEIAVSITTNEADSMLVNSIYVATTSTAVGSPAELTLSSTDATQDIRVNLTDTGLLSESLMATRLQASTGAATTVTSLLAVTSCSSSLNFVEVVFAVAPAIISSVSPSASPSVSPSISPSASPSVSPSISPSVSPSASISPSVSPSVYRGANLEKSGRATSSSAFIPF